MTKLTLATEKMKAEKSDGIGWITFNNPDRRNAIGYAMREAILEIIEDFESVEKFKDQFKQAGITQFGSGWCWLSLNNDKLVVTKTANAANPLIENMKPLLGCDVWEHSYYIDYRNRRPEYLDKFVDNLIDWEFVESLLI